MRALLGTAPVVVWLLMTAVPAAAQQSDTIWACEDDQGHKVFQNVGNGRGCRREPGRISPNDLAKSMSRLDSRHNGCEFVS